jgi:multidrug resistance efflux pump
MTIKRRPVVACLGLALLAMVAMGAHWILAAKDNSLPTSAGETQSQDNTLGKVVLSGFVDVEDGIIQLYPLQPGRVKKVLVQENQVVEKGAKLLSLDDTVAQLKLKEAEEALRAATAQYKKAKQMPEMHQSKLAQQKEAVEAMEKRLAGARLKIKRAKELLDAGFLKPEEYEAAQEQIKELEAGDRAEREKQKELGMIDPTQDVTAAEALVAVKKALVKEAKFALEEQTLRAPAKGIVLRINVGSGDVLGPIPKDAAILFAPDHPRIIRVNVEQEFAEQVKVGYAAEARDFTNPNLGPWKGKVTRVSDVFMQPRTLLPQRFSLNADESRTLECLVVLENNPPLRLGQRVRVTIRPQSGK